MADTATITTRAPKLAQLIAVRPGVKTDTSQALTELYHAIQKTDLLKGLARTYTPQNEDGFQYPPEGNQVLVKCTQVLDQTANLLTRLFDVTAQMDWTNTQAKADVVVYINKQPVKLLVDVPVTYLMFLEKQLVHVETLIRRLPVVDPTENWTYDPAIDVHKTDPIGSVKTAKVRRNHVKAEATERHPAQVESFVEDVPIGTWSTVKFSGALPQARVNALLGRVTALLEAVKFAREEANEIELVNIKPGRKVFDYLFAAGE